MNRYGIVGYPLGHTLSPTLHNWAFAKYKIEAIYEAWPTPPEQLSSFIERVRAERIQGVSVTIPHKEAVFDHIDTVSTKARAVGAVNILFWKNGQLKGTNTDVAGFVAPLKALDVNLKSALVLGAGGAARAVLAGLNELRVARIILANRTPENAHRLADEFCCEWLPWDERHTAQTDIIVNTTPMGMAGGNEARSPWPMTQISCPTVVYDLVYNPLDTLFLRDAKASGCTTISGLDMLLHQGLAQFELWTGIRPDAEEGMQVLRSALQG